MRDAHIGFLPVCDDRDRLIGVVTDRDMAVRLCATGEVPGKTPIEAIMSTDVVSCSPAADVRDAEMLMAQNRKSRIVVVADDGTPEGVISLSDLAGRPGAEAADLLRMIAGREVLAPGGVKPRNR
jgi:CBS domain-containing protein